MKNKKSNIFYDVFSDLDEKDIEKIAEEIPSLDSKAKKRILNNCMKKMKHEELTDDFEPEITVSGTEKITNSRFKFFAVTAAAFAVVTVGISGMILINKNLSGTVEPTPESSAKLIMSSNSNEIRKSIDNSESPVARTTAVISSDEKIISESQILTVQTETSTVAAEVNIPENTDAISDVQDTEVIENLPDNLIGIWRNEYRGEPRFISIDDNGNFCAYNENGDESNSGMIGFSRTGENDQKLYFLTSYDNTLNFEICLHGDNYFNSVDSVFAYERIGSEFGIPIVDDALWCGEYTMANGGDSVNIIKTGDNSYSIELSFYRTANYTDGIGSVDDNGNLNFMAGSVSGAPKITGQLIPWGDGIYLKITESEHAYIPVDSLSIEEWGNYLYYKQE